MEGWKEYYIQEIGEVIGGGTPSTGNLSYYNGNIAWITPKDLTNYDFRFISKGERNISELGLKNSSARLMPKGSVLMTSRAPIGYLAISSNSVSTNQGFRSIIVNEKIAHNLFIYYLLLGNIELIKSKGSGTTFAEISGSVFKELSFLLPPLPLQHRIAEILGALDDKIELNRQMNHTLEQMAQALYKHYFVDDIDPENLPEGWRKGVLGDIFNITMGQSPAGKSYNMDKTGILFFQGRTDFGFRFPEARMYTTEPTRYAKKFDTLVSVRAPVGDINIAYDDCCVGRGLAAVQHKSNKPSFTFYTLKNLRNDFDTFNGEGTVFGSINKEDFNRIPVVIPSDSTLNTFESKAKHTDDLIFTNHNEILNLTLIRDFLLPKLISGEVIPSDLQTLENAL